MDKILYSISEACAALSLSRSALYALMKRGDLRYVEIGTVRRIPRAELDRIVSEGAAIGTPLAKG